MQPVAYAAATDRELVALCQQGEEGAFDELVTRHHARAFHMAYPLLLNHDAAREVAQNAFVKIYRSVVELRGDIEFADWLREIIENLAGRQPLWRAHADSALATSLQELPVVLQEPLLLRNVERMNYEQIAAMLDCSASAVRTRIARARERLAGAGDPGHGLSPELSALLDGELTSARQAEIELHLTGCAACRQHWDELRRAAETVAALPKAPAAAEFLAEVRGKIARGEGPPDRTWVDFLFRPVWVKLPLWVAALLVVLTSFWLPDDTVQLPAGESPAKRARRQAIVRTPEPKLERPPVEFEPVDSVLVEAGDATMIARLAEETAGQLDGVVAGIRPLERGEKVFVSLPVGNVVGFRSRFGEALKAAGNRYWWSEVFAGHGTNRVVVEIVIVPVVP